MQVIPIVAVRFAFWLDSTNVGITPTCTSYLGAESWASRRRGHHAYADAQRASDVISATAVPVDTIIVITYRG